MKKVVRTLLEQMVNNVANYFLDCMKENDFETFDEMKECYWWTSKDIKNEVDSILKDHGWSIDEIDVDESTHTGVAFISLHPRQY